MTTILSVVGARPQFVKAAVFSRFVRRPEWSDKVREILVHTGQHYDRNMSEVFFREMEIPEADVNLAVGSGSHGAMTGAMLAKIEELILDRKPDLVLVYGDTNSTLAGALAASKLGVPVAHVEAGLRSYMMAMPEEQNRRLADHLSTWLFCPTAAAVANLGREGIAAGDGGEAGAAASSDRKDVLNVGDIMLEASIHYRRSARERGGAVLAGLPESFHLLTIHRAENTDDPARLRAIVEAINESGQDVVFPIHPRTRKIMEAEGLRMGPRVRILDPVGYYEMLCLEESCACVVTDSGGVQKEAYFAGKPCVTLRDATEWIELVEAGWNTLVGADKRSIVAAMSAAPTRRDHPPLYGTGETAEKIIKRLLSGK